MSHAMNVRFNGLSLHQLTVTWFVFMGCAPMKPNAHKTKDNLKGKFTLITIYEFS